MTAVDGIAGGTYAPTVPAAIVDVIAGARRWCVIEGDCVPILRAIDLSGGVDSLRLITDGPYGVGEAEETADDGPYVEALKLLTEARSRAFFGYAETLCDWIATLRLSQGASRWGKPDEWVTWCPSNAEAKAGAQSKSKLPKLTEHIAIYGKTPGVRELRRERAKGGKKLAGKKGLIELRRFSPKAALRETAQLGDLWTDPAPGIGFQSGSRLHPNEKPVSVLQKLTLLTSEPGDVVIDPFAGSGTTGVAALREGRRVILIEREPRFALLCRERMEAEASGSTLEAGARGTGSHVRGHECLTS